MAFQGEQVLVIDADLRKPGLGKTGAARQEGLSFLLARREDPIRYIVEKDGLNLLPSNLTLPTPQSYWDPSG